MDHSCGLVNTTHTEIGNPGTIQNIASHRCSRFTSSDFNQLQGLAHATLGLQNSATEP
jgi:hypothetical protein